MAKYFAVIHEDSAIEDLDEITMLTEEQVIETSRELIDGKANTLMVAELELKQNGFVIVPLVYSDIEFAGYPSCDTCVEECKTYDNSLPCSDYKKCV